MTLTEVLARVVDDGVMVVVRKSIHKHGGIEFLLEDQMNVKEGQRRYAKSDITALELSKLISPDESAAGLIDNLHSELRS